MRHIVQMVGVSKRKTMSLGEVSIIKETIEFNFPELKNVLNLEQAHKVSV